MAITFPFPWAEFGGLMPIQSASLKLKRFEQITWTGNSQAAVSDLGDPRWGCKVLLGPMLADEAAEIQTLIELHGSGHPFALHDPARMWPRADPNGTILGAATPTIKTVGATGLAFQGLPAGYTLTRGDRVSVAHGSEVARALYLVAQTTVADGLGSTGIVPLLPTPRATAAPDQPASLIAATALVIIVPDTYEPGENTGATVKGITFDVIEAL